MKKYNLSQIMKKAWKLVKELSLTMSAALKQAWKEAKDTTATLAETLVSNLGEMAYNCPSIHAGMERKVSTNLWEKNGNKRLYLNINCYSLTGNSKGSYKCGYIDILTGSYVVTKWDEVNAQTMEYIGR